MQIKINGEIKTIKDNMTLKEVLEDLDNLPKVFVVELNRKIINKNDYQTTALKDNDSLEIVHFCAGG